METDGRDNQPRTEEPRDEGNVVRFPRDWFGSVDDLVPVGPRARAAEVVRLGGGEPEAPPADVAAEPARATVTTADDFWGEGSAELQHAVQAPVGRAARAAAVRPARRMAWSVPALRLSALGRPAWGRPALRLPAVPLRRVHGLVALGLVAAIVAIVAGIPSQGGSLGSADGGKLPLGAIASQAAATGLSPGVDALSVGRVLSSGPPPVRHPRAAGRRRASSVASSNRRPANTRSAATHVGHASQSSSQESVPVVTSSPTPEASPSPSTGSAGSGTGASGAGPVGPGAAFGPGYMG